MIKVILGRNVKGKRTVKCYKFFHRIIYGNREKAESLFHGDLI